MMIMSGVENFYFGDLRSCTVDAGDVHVVRFAAGEEYSGCFFEETTTAIVDLYPSGKIRNIRQEVSGSGRVWQAYFGTSAAKANKLRQWAKWLGCEMINVPGGVTPIMPVEYVAVPDFSMNGTNWYLFPTALADLVGGYYVDGLA